MRRILCVWLPGWPIQRLRHARPELEGQPLALYTPGSRGQMVLTACSRSAAERGIKPGMPLAEAKAMVGLAGRASDGESDRRLRVRLTGVHFELHDPRADREALRQLAVECQRFTPLVAVEEAEQPESLLFDITGCAILFGGEEALVGKVADYFHRAGYWATVAIADTIGAAWAVAHSQLEICNLQFAICNIPQQIVPPAKQSEALRLLPVAALRLSDPTLDCLHEFDICRIDQLLALPKADLLRLDPEVGRRLDQALGNIPEVLNPEWAEEALEASWPFETPTADRRIIETVLQRLLEQVLNQLQPRERGVQRLLCSLRPVGGEPLYIPVGLLKPTVSTKHLLELVRLHFEHLCLAAEIAAIAVRVSIAVPLECHQEPLFGKDAGAERRKQFPALIERLSNRLGEQAVLRPRLYPDHQPELACRYASWLRNDKEGPRLKRKRSTAPQASLTFQPRTSTLARPPRLMSQPIAIPVMSVVPGGPPLRFEWKNQNHVVAHYWGPERIETGWWREQGIRRDYYLVETEAGTRFWLFRRMGDEAWFLHGTFG